MQCSAMQNFVISFIYNFPQARLTYNQFIGNYNQFLVIVTTCSVRWGVGWIYSTIGPIGQHTFCHTLSKGKA